MFYIIGFLGQIAGYFLGMNSPEEMKSGKKYFIILKYIFLISILIYILTQPFNLYLLIAGLILGFIIKNEYLAFGCLPIHYIPSILIFLYGLPYGTELYIKKNYKRMLINAIYFIPLIVILISNYNLTSLGLGLLIYNFKPNNFNFSFKRFSTSFRNIFR